MADYDLLLLGISTWDFGEIQEDWNELWEDIATTPMKGKVVALSFFKHVQEVLKLTTA